MSKFDKIFKAREESNSEPEGKTAASPKAAAKAKPPAKKTPKSPSPPPPSPEPKPVAKKRGRPTAKRSDPNYLGFTTYIHRDVHRKVKLRLLENAEDQQLSELVEELLRKWLNKM